ncbi:MAG: PRC-barrel domain-containing protein, partial [Vicinamibacterales bacterium]
GGVGRTGATMTRTRETTLGTHLCYLSASKLDSSAGALSQMDVRTVDGEGIGDLDGVLIDPAARRILYYVIALRRRFGCRRYLLPADAPVQVESAGKALRFGIVLPALESCQEFRKGDVRDFSDTDVVTAMFARTA